MADDLNPQEYAKRLSGTRVDALVRAAVAALLDEYRAELARDPAFILPAAEKMIRALPQQEGSRADTQRVYFYAGAVAVGGEHEQDTLIDAYTKLLAARKDRP